MKKIKISVIIPIFNSEKWIKLAVESILNQSLKDIEIICIDDGSTDSSYAICKFLAQKDSRIIVMQQANKGVSAARNKGINSAKGKYIIFLDSDDYYVKDSLITMFDDINSTGVDCIFYNHFYDYNGRLIPRKPRLDSGEYTFKDVMTSILDDGTLTGILFGSSCGVIYTTEIIKKYNIKFNENIKINEDGLFNIDYLIKTKKFVYYGDSFLYCYRQYKRNSHNNIKLLYQRYNEANKYCSKFVSTITNMDQQLLSRSITVAFQLSVIACNQMAGKKLNVLINDLWRNFDLAFYCKHMNFHKINLYKRVLAFFMCTKQIKLFVLVVKQVYPLLKSHLRR